MAEPSLLQRLQSQLQSMRELPPNWNSYGAPPVTKEALETAQTLLDLGFEPVNATPANDGGVCLEFQHFELWIQPTGKVEVAL